LPSRAIHPAIFFNASQRAVIRQTAVLADAAKQCVLGSAVGASTPARVLLAGIALPPLQNPLQRVIDDPPARVELRYEAIGGVRWALGALGVRSIPRE
jgi:hypothetical protein